MIRFGMQVFILQEQKTLATTGTKGSLSRFPVFFSNIFGNWFTKTTLHQPCFHYWNRWNLQEPHGWEVLPFIISTYRGVECCGNCQNYTTKNGIPQKRECNTSQICWPNDMLQVKCSDMCLQKKLAWHKNAGVIWPARRKPPTLEGWFGGAGNK